MTTNTPDPAPELGQRRERAAKLVYEQRDTIKSRIHRMIGNQARLVTDTEDVLSTALRRVDSLISRGQDQAQSDEQFFALVHGVIDRCIKEKSRNASRLRARELVAQRLREERWDRQPDPRVMTSEQLEHIGRSIPDPLDRQIILLRGRNLSFESIAQAMRLEPGTVRKRWSRLRVKAREQLDKERPHAVYEPVS